MCVAEQSSFLSGQVRLEDVFSINLCTANKSFGARRWAAVYSRSRVYRAQACSALSNPEAFCTKQRLFTPNQGFWHQKAKGLSMQKLEVPGDQQLSL